MRKTLPFLALILFPILPLFAQDASMSKAEKKKIRKEIRRIEDSLLYANASLALQNKNWVLEANTLQSKSGYTIQVNSTTNFIMVEGDKGTVQLASPNRVGYNGLGGITLQGNISSYNVKTDKRGSVSVDFIVIGNGINASIFITLYPGSNQGSAAVSSNTWSSKLTYNGYFFLRDDSDVYKGMAR